jgi:hypothetical protein
MTLVHLLVLLIVVAAVVMIAVVALRAMGVEIPPWVKQIGWIILIAIVAVLAIKFVAAYL